MTHQITVAGRPVGAGHPTFVIAEMSGNHNGSLKRALQIIDAVADTGAQAIKFQTYTADTITIDCDGPAFRVDGEHGLWGGRNLYRLYQEAATPWEWHEAMFARAREHGLIPFSSPFDVTAIELLESLDAPCYKVASAELVDLPLIRAMAGTGKPLIMSTGMATIAEIDAAVSAARGAGCTELALLTCTSAYPASPDDAALANIAVLEELFGCPAGLSDHTLGNGVAVASVALGGSLIEKHVTLRRADGGVDSAFSLEPAEVAALVAECDAARRAVAGPARFATRDAEQTVKRLRRSLYVVADVRAGDEVNASNVRSIRPGGGLAPDAFASVRGRRFRADVPQGTPLTWDVL